MSRLFLAVALTAAFGSSAIAAPRSITIVNGTGAPLADVAAKRVDGKEWQALTPGLSAGARTGVTIDTDMCAYDVRGSLAGTSVTWRGVNLCETRSVTLNRRSDGALWVDYD